MGVFLRLRDVLVAALLVGAFYWVLIDTVDLPELYALGVAALLGAAGFEAARERAVSELSFKPGWVLRSLRGFARVPADVILVISAILGQIVRPRQERGVWRASPFRHGGERNARDAARRTLAEAAGSLAPNTIVIGIDPDSDLILVHQLKRYGGTGAVDVLGLG